jgi:hypothetical protein
METTKRKQYPFNEGFDYWTIENNKVIWSSWDDVSEELHDANPNKVYFKTEEEANLFLNSNKPTFDINEGVLVSGVACVITSMLGKTTADVILQTVFFKEIVFG